MLVKSKRMIWKSVLDDTRAKLMDIVEKGAGVRVLKLDNLHVVQREAERGSSDVPECCHKESLD